VCGPAAGPAGPAKTFLQKAHVGNKLTQKDDKNLTVSSSSAFLVLTRFRVFLSDGSSKTLPKTFSNNSDQL
jgi:hypothetical protein